MPEEVVIKALQRAFWSQPPTPGLLVHSDRGGQYCGNAYRQLLHDHEALRSQSRRGDCYYNTQAENRLKVLVACGRASKWRFSSPRAARFCGPGRSAASVADYFDYYNHERLHSSIHYQAPY